MERQKPDTDDQRDRPLPAHGVLAAAQHAARCGCARSRRRTRSRTRACTSARARPQPDVGAFGYAAARLPECMPRISRVVLGQSDETYAAFGFRRAALAARAHARPPAAAALGRRRDAGRVRRERVRHRRPGADPDRLPDRVEQDARPDRVGAARARRARTRRAKAPDLARGARALGRRRRAPARGARRATPDAALRGDRARAASICACGCSPARSRSTSARRSSGGSGIERVYLRDAGGADARRSTSCRRTRTRSRTCSAATRSRTATSCIAAARRDPTRRRRCRSSSASSPTARPPTPNLLYFALRNYLHADPDALERVQALGRRGGHRSRRRRGADRRPGAGDRARAAAARAPRSAPAHARARAAARERRAASSTSTTRSGWRRTTSCRGSARARGRCAASTSWARPRR